MSYRDAIADITEMFPPELQTGEEILASHPKWLAYDCGLLMCGYFIGSGRIGNEILLLFRDYIPVRNDDPGEDGIIYYRSGYVIAVRQTQTDHSVIELCVRPEISLQELLTMISPPNLRGRSRLLSNSNIRIIKPFAIQCA